MRRTSDSPAGRSEPAAAISAALASFLRRGRIARVRVGGGSTPPPPLAYAVHFPRLAVTLRGADPMLLEQGGRIRRIRPVRGDAVLVPANCWNRPDWTERSVALNVLFGRKQVGLSLVAHDGRRPEPGPAAKTAIAGVWETPLRDMMRALAGLAEGSPAAPPLVEAILHACREALRRPAPAAAGRAAAFYDTVCMYVQEHFQFPLGRASVAEHFRVSPGHISRLFRRQGEVGFSDYLTYVRVDRAKYLLKSYGQTIGEVAAACGFSDSAYFCRVFKRVTRLTPGDYRQQVRSR